jgi:hypothetical protein
VVGEQIAKSLEEHVLQKQFNELGAMLLESEVSVKMLLESEVSVKMLLESEASVKMLLNSPVKTLFHCGSPGEFEFDAPL